MMLTTPQGFHDNGFSKTMQVTQKMVLKVYIGETQVQSGERGKRVIPISHTDAIQKQILHLEKVVTSYFE